MDDTEAVVTQSELVKRSSSILSECSETCVQLQETLSPLLAIDTHLSGEAMIQMQALDRMSQQLEDLASLLSECANNFGNQPAIFERTLASTTKLNETRDKLFGCKTEKHDPFSSSDVDLF